MELGENCKKLIAFIENNKDKIAPLDTDDLRQNMIIPGAPITTSEAMVMDLIEKYDNAQKGFEKDVFSKLLAMYEQCKRAQTNKGE